MNTTDPQQPVIDLRAALHRRDAAAASELLRVVPVAVAVTDGQPLVGLIDGRVLPVFLSFDSWEAFGSTDEVRPLPTADFLAVLEHAAVDAILVDPAMPTAIEIPTEDVTALLRGAVPEEGGSSRILGDLHARTDAALRDRVAKQLAGDLSPPLLTRLWAFSRVIPGGSVPTIALAAGLDDADVQRAFLALHNADLPPNLEALVLDDDQTRTADQTWHDARIQQPTTPQYVQDRVGPPEPMP